ncbi:MAG: hypothetical protein QM625_22245 [Ralstonia sp.]|jgi:hypothetical protein|uniref:Uncharacterized protein n=2 Tax=Ralstonia pickettii TaxID=329 RepID=A0A2P4RFP4_RALPI|nr:MULTISPECIES: hypothetical protein [Ralstonia]MBA4232340.1 hypothetical protein [Ralstonia sp.]MBA4236440.1 hypothetical protein [Ralstonia sp.]MBA9847787.1 hypothetical protein [Ralstonia pickettii]MBA9853305.1 hypothetical protein [Ralstonia pickettii]MBA9879496.1 hypothetical protein [Ralstonia pickettii]
MTSHHCPSCRSLTAPHGTILRSDGQREALYRCNSHSCGTVFSHALPVGATPEDSIQTYRLARNTQDVIRTDC